MQRFWLVVQLQARLTLRAYLHSKPALLGLALLLLLTVPASWNLAFRCHKLLSGPSASSITAWLFLAIFGLFALAPLASAATLATGSDTGRLQLYPIPPRVLSAALAAAGLADLPTLLLLPFLPVLMGHFGIAGLLALVLLVAVGLLVGQTFQLLGGALVRRRRVREGLGLVLPMVAAVGVLLLVRQPAQAASPTTAPSLPTAPSLLQLTPPGLAAALAGGSILAGLALAACAGALFALNGGLLARLAGRETESDSAGWRLSLQPLATGPGAALAAKDLAYYQREPYFRGAIGRSSITLLLIATVVLHPTNENVIRLGPTLGPGLVIYLFLWALERLANQWGAESAAGTFLWSLPGRRWRWVLGKNAAVAPLVALLAALLLAEYGYLVGAPLLRLLTFFGVALTWLLAALALGNLISVPLPFPVLGKAAQQSAGQSFGTSCLYLLIGVVAAALCQVPFAPLVNGALWLASIPLAGRWLEKRERAMVAALG